MRQTCLKCGHQVDLAVGETVAPQVCVCGRNFGQACSIDMGVQPSVRAAEALRARAFRAAGLVRNVGGFALAVALMGFVFFPLGLLGAALGVWVLFTLRGPLGRYGGRTHAIWAIALGLGFFIIEGSLCLRWLHGRREADTAAIQETAAEDLRDLLRAERLYRATSEHFGGFAELHFKPRHGLYTLYLDPTDVLPATRDGVSVLDPLPGDLPAGHNPHLAANAFVAVAVANLDPDPDVDVWAVNAAGDIVHVRTDAAAP
jgi:hypothetical protein